VGGDAEVPSAGIEPPRVQLFETLGVGSLVVLSEVAVMLSARHEPASPDCLGRADESARQTVGHSAGGDSLETETDNAPGRIEETSVGQVTIYDRSAEEGDRQRLSTLRIEHHDRSPCREDVSDRSCAR
jgi:hypothetical protein